MTRWGRTGRSLSLAAVAACGLAACQTAGGSPAGKPIAFESIEGAPAAVRTALAGELASAAFARQVEIVGNGNPARYRVRGYLTAEPTADGGTALAAPIKAASRKNPWDGLDKEALARLAARSMDEIATFLAAGPAAAEPAEASDG